MLILRVRRLVEARAGGRVHAHSLFLSYSAFCYVPLAISSRRGVCMEDCVVCCVLLCSLSSWLASSLSVFSPDFVDEVQAGVMVSPSSLQSCVRSCWG